MMLTIYGKLMPLRVLEEVRYWKMQEKEHTIGIREFVPTLAPEYVQLLAQWETVLGKTEDEATSSIQALLEQQPEDIRSTQLDHIQSLVHMSLGQSQEFKHHLQLLLSRSPDIGSNPTATIAITQMIRESEYFLGVNEALLQSERSPFRTGTDTGHGTPAGPLLAQGSTTPSTATPSTSTTPSTAPSTSTSTTTATSPVAAQPVYGWRTDQTYDATIPNNPVPIGGHQLPPLPYPYDALEPYIDETIMRLHHQKHHASYVEGLNQAEKMMKTARETNDFALLKHWEREAAFNGAGHYLHTIFWNVMSPNGGGKATGAIAAQIERDFGSFERFKQHFSQAAEKVEGGGWAILVWSPRSHRLEILQAEKHQNLTQWDVVPLLVLDVWEHAYYLQYENDRKKYIQAWWNTVNWDHVNERFLAARNLRWTPY